MKLLHMYIIIFMISIIY